MLDHIDAMLAPIGKTHLIYAQTKNSPGEDVFGGQTLGRRVLLYRAQCNYGGLRTSLALALFTHLHHLYGHHAQVRCSTSLQ